MTESHTRPIAATSENSSMSTLSQVSRRSSCQVPASQNSALSSHPPSRAPRTQPLLAATLGAALLAVCVDTSATGTCRAVSGPAMTTVVELYTSEGCSSCPPADRWLSTLRGQPDVVTLGFHVDYWDSLGWKDRFAQPAFTARQAAGLRTNGARFAYTPQVVVNGRDTPDWIDLRPAALVPRGRARVDLALEQSATGLALTVTPAAGAPAQVSGYLAAVDDGLASHVGAGENQGATLHHDGVVRTLQPWHSDGPQTLHFTPTATPEPGATRHWIAVATDATGQPLQALSLACGR